MGVADKIRELYKEKGFSLRSLAEKLEMTQPGLSKMLKNDDFKVSTLEKIANALEVDISTLFSQDSIKSKFVKEEEIKNIKSTIFTTFVKNIDPTDDEKSWLPIIKIAKELEKKGVIAKSWQLCEQSTFERVSLLPDFDIQKLKRLWELQFKIHSWLYDSSYQTSEKVYESLEVPVLNNDEFEYSKFLLFIYEHNYSTIPEIMQNEFDKEMKQFRKYLQSFLANLVLENDVFQQLALMGIVSELYTNTKVIEYFMVDIKFCRGMFWHGLKLKGGKVPPNYLKPKD